MSVPSSTLLITIYANLLPIALALCQPPTTHANSSLFSHLVPNFGENCFVFFGVRRIGNRTQQTIRRYKIRFQTCNPKLHYFNYIGIASRLRFTIFKAECNSFGCFLPKLIIRGATWCGIYKQNILCHFPWYIVSHLVRLRSKLFLV